MTSASLFGQKRVKIASEEIQLFGDATDPYGLTYNGVPIVTGTGSLVTLGPVGNQPNANGASLSEGILVLQPGGSGFPGVLVGSTLNDYNSNTALGLGALQGITTGFANTALGKGAAAILTTARGVVAIGDGALSDLNTGGNIIAIGNNAGSAYSSEHGNICIGSNGNPGDVNTTRIGLGTTTTTFIDGIYGVTPSGSTSTVIMNANGQLGTGSGGGISLAPVGSSPNADGASFATGTLTLQPADATNPGVISATTQTIGGDKTLTGDLYLTNTNARIFGPFVNGVYPTYIHCPEGGGVLTNNFFGMNAGNDTLIGSDNTGVGCSVLNQIENGSFNTGVGSVCFSQLDGHASYNTSVGYDSMSEGESPNQCTAVGAFALKNANTGSSKLTAIGFQAGQTYTTESNNIVIGNLGTAADSGVIRIGTPSTHTTFFAAGVTGVSVAGGLAGLVNSSGQFGTTTSSKKRKRDIEPLDLVSSKKIHLLNMVRFKYHETEEPQYGVIVEQTDEIMPDLTVKDEHGEFYGFQYHKLLPMVVREVQDHETRMKAMELELKTLKASLLK